MQFIRPEIREAIWRCREAVIGVAVSLIGLNWAINGLGILSIIGTSLAIAGAILVFAGIQQARFRTGGGGAGVVIVDEALITYYGPKEGGSKSIKEMNEVELMPQPDGHPEWVLHDDHSPPLHIPTNAEGANDLFDVFAALEGIETERMLAQLQKAPSTPVTIWARPEKHAKLSRIGMQS